MQSKITEYTNVSEKLSDLGCKHPSGIAILPVNFEAASTIAEFRQTSEAATVKTLFRAANIPHGDIVEAKDRPPYIQNNAFEWIAPTLFISAALLSENSACVAVALNVIANYATDYFRGMSGNNNVKLEIVVEKTRAKSCQKISYEGPPEGLKDLVPVVEAAKDE